MPVVIDVAAQDFPDAAQRFNWCSCQREAPALTARLGQMTSDALLPSSLPVTPIFDFSFWESSLTGGGGGMPTNQTGAPGQIISSVATAAGSVVSNFWPLLLLAGGVLILTTPRIWNAIPDRRKKGRR